MGVSGLWTILNKAGVTRSLANLAIVDGFEKNEHGSRSFRIGIDANIWLTHAAFSAGRKGEDRGANSEIRTLFFRLCRLSKMPFSILFVFDGRSRPHVKRGSMMGKSGTHNLAKDFKQLIELFGMDWREAKGEAEAQLAWLNQQGIIDAIISDDVDTLIFGARMVLKNVSTKLTGNKSNPALNANGKPSEHHANVYTADAIENHPEVRLKRGGMILIALLSGGDYDSGIRGAGLDAGHALASLGYGEELLRAYEELGPQDFQDWLPQWRERMTEELRTNASGLLSKRYLSLTIPSTFPPMDSLQKYARPAVFETQTRKVHDRRAVDLPALAAFCEAHFTEWGHASAILKRFHSLVYEGVAMTVFRASAVEADRRERERQVAAGRRPCDVRLGARWHPDPDQAVGTPAVLVKRCAAPPRKRRADKDAQMEEIAAAFVNRGTPEPEVRPDEALDFRAGGGRDERDRLVVAIHSSRRHTSTDQLLEYRVEVCVKQLVEYVESGIKGKHPEPGARAGSSKAGGKGKGKEKRRSRRYEDTDSEEDEDQQAEPLGDVAEADGEGSDGDGGHGRAKGEGDPRANMRIWVPASIIRHVHPELVAEYEDKQAAKKTKSTPKKRSATVRHDSDDDDAPEAQPGSSQHARSAARAKSKGKGKARQKGGDLEDDVVRGNPYASFDPPRDGFEVDLKREAHSSLPLRKCGFVFTWPDPDDPDALIVDTGARDDLPTMVDYADVERTGMLVYREGDGIFATIVGPSARRTARPSQTRARGKVQEPAGEKEKKAEPAKGKGKGKERAGPSHGRSAEDSVARERDEEDSDQLDAGWSLYAEYRKQSQAPRDSPRAPSRGAKADKNAASASTSQPQAASRALKKGKARARESDDEEAVPTRPAKRRKTSLGFSVDPDALRDSSEEPELPWRPPPRHSPALADIIEVENLVAFSRSPSPAYIPPSSPVQMPPPSSSPAPTPSSSRTAPVNRRRKLPLDDDIIEISSDSDDGKPAAGGGQSDDDLKWWQRPPFNNQPSLYSQRRASSSRGSLIPSWKPEDPDVEEEEGEDLWAEVEAEFSQRSEGAKSGGPWSESAVAGAGRKESGASSSRTQLTRKRTYRNEPFPSSSQESMLDEDGAGFHKGPSVVIDLT
ncbi:hypothetical protein FKP32DRAFT_1634581 [Trametes sanguinea]|nr:hypothetical protein FKP32DRAFT_1634581 [Trametes sanguinea]